MWVSSGSISNHMGYLMAAGCMKDQHQSHVGGAINTVINTTICTVYMKPGLQLCLHEDISERRQETGGKLRRFGLLDDQLSPLDRQCFS